MKHMWIESVIIPFLLTAAVTYAVTPLVIFLAGRFRWVDDPIKRYHPAHTHTGIVPRAGGFALFIGITVMVILLLPWNKLYLGIILSSAILIFIGLCDDRKDVSPYLRIATNIVAIILVIFAGAGVPYITNPATGGILHLDTWRISFNVFGSHSLLVWSAAVAFLWLMWTTHIVGWSGGVEGQMPGFVAISAAVIGLLSLRYSIFDASQVPITVFAFIISGAFMGFLPWNFTQQKIMPGYGGKTIAGFLLGILAILSYGKLGTALLVLGIPTIDAVFILTRRLVHQKSLVRADRRHLHHFLMDAGWGKRKIALFYWVVSAILGTVALTVTSTQKIFAFILVAVVIGGFLVWVNFFSQFSSRQGPDNG